MRNADCGVQNLTSWSQIPILGLSAPGLGMRFMIAVPAPADRVILRIDLIGFAEFDMCIAEHVVHATSVFEIEQLHHFNVWPKPNAIAR